MNQSRIFTLSALDKALKRILTPYGIQASDGTLFRGAIFGRDSVWVARMLLYTHKEVAQLAIMTLAKTQGIKNNLENEEQPGRIAHEWRNRTLPGSSLSIFNKLAKQWGGEIAPGVMCYYGSVDATSLWVTLVAEYCAVYGPDILEREIDHQSGGRVILRDSLLRAVAWIEHRLDKSDLGLIECYDFYKTDPQRLEWQVLRDGFDSYMFADGSLPNHKAPIVFLGVQGFTYDALISASELLGNNEASETTNRWRERAKCIQEAVFKRFWMPEKKTFAAALDRDPRNNNIRQLDTLMSSAGDLLETRIFETLGGEERKYFVEATVKSLYSPDMLTSVGVRSISLAHSDTLPYWAYQGSMTSWPVITGIFARGLRRQGFNTLAIDMGNRLQNGIRAGGCPREFWYVAPDGTVAYDPEGDYANDNDPKISATNVGEKYQAWTIATAIEALHYSHDRSILLKPKTMERDILSTVTTASLFGLNESKKAFERRYRGVVHTDNVAAAEIMIMILSRSGIGVEQS